LSVYMQEREFILLDSLASQNVIYCVVSLKNFVIKYIYNEIYFQIKYDI